MDQARLIDPSVDNLTELDRSGNANERQSLISRSKRILGDNVELGDAQPSSSKKSSEQGHEHEVVEVPDKRREQVRSAQRTHRQRTQTYIKSLEREVLRLRIIENEALARVAALQLQVGMLLTTLEAHHIPVPFGFDAGLPKEPGTGLVTLNPQDSSALLVNLSSADSTKFPTPPQNLRDPNIFSGTAPPSFDGSTPLDLEIPTSLLNDPQIGIDFVLELERPCLPHLRNSHLDYSEENEDEGSKAHSHKVSGHIFTTSLSLWRPTIPTRSEKEAYEIPAEQIRRLLANSHNIGVDKDQITPVQLWHRLQDLGCDESRQKEVLERLTMELASHVDCFHFGAVMDLQVVNTILEEVLRGKTYMGAGQKQATPET